MELKRIHYRLTVCKVADISVFDINTDFYFIGKTDEEVSLVCRTEDAPSVTRYSQKSHVSKHGSADNL